MEKEYNNHHPRLNHSLKLLICFLMDISILEIIKYISHQLF